MGKCQCITDGFPCGQEARPEMEVCYYHLKMLQGHIQPYREQDIKVTFKEVTINKR